MGQRQKTAVTGESAAEQEMRNQEVLRANRELAAYFKGRRTEREARAALKIIKAFVREREHRDPGSRPQLPGGAGDVVAKRPGEVTNRKTASDGGKRRRKKPRPKPRARSARSATASTEAQANPESPLLSDAGDRTPQ